MSIGNEATGSYYNYACINNNSELVIVNFTVSLKKSFYPSDYHRLGSPPTFGLWFARLSD